MVDQNTIVSMTNANFTESTYTNNKKKKIPSECILKAKPNYILYTDDFFIF